MAGGAGCDILIILETLWWICLGQLFAVSFTIRFLCSTNGWICRQLTQIRLLDVYTEMHIESVNTCIFTLNLSSYLSLSISKSRTWNIQVAFGTKYTTMDQVKLMEDKL